jgi:hypothetical protein
MATSSGWDVGRRLDPNSPASTIGQSARHPPICHLIRVPAASACRRRLDTGRPGAENGWIAGRVRA